MSDCFSSLISKYYSLNHLCSLIGLTCNNLLRTGVCTCLCVCLCMVVPFVPCPPPPPTRRARDRVHWRPGAPRLVRPAAKVHDAVRPATQHAPIDRGAIWGSARARGEEDQRRAEMDTRTYKIWGTSKQLEWGTAICMWGAFVCLSKRGGCVKFKFEPCSHVAVFLSRRALSDSYSWTH